MRWIGELGDADLDPKLLMWDMHRNVDHAAVAPDRWSCGSTSTGAPRGSRLVAGDRPGDVDVCDDDPGFEVSVTVTAGLRDLTEIWRGENDWPEALRTGAVVVEGPVGLRRSLPSWFVSPLAGANRSGEPAL